MTHEKNPEQTRKNIIQAAKEILGNGGFFTQFSLAKVAERAGVSKGGLMHHFGSKDALLHGISDAIIQEFEGQLAENVKVEASGSGQFTRAYIKTALLSDNRPQDVNPVLLAFHRSVGSDKAETRFNHWQEGTANDGLAVARATIIRLAVDGLLYQEVIDGEPIEAGLREGIMTELYKMVDEAS
jgi:AcrR family transcriptional regulator